MFKLAFKLLWSLFVGSTASAILIALFSFYAIPSFAGQKPATYNVNQTHSDDEEKKDNTILALLTNAKNIVIPCVLDDVKISDLQDDGPNDVPIFDGSPTSYTEVRSFYFSMRGPMLEKLGAMKLIYVPDLMDSSTRLPTWLDGDPKSRTEVYYDSSLAKFARIQRVEPNITFVTKLLLYTIAYQYGASDIVAWHFAKSILRAFSPAGRSRLWNDYRIRLKVDGLTAPLKRPATVNSQTITLIDIPPPKRVLRMECICTHYYGYGEPGGDRGGGQDELIRTIFFTDGTQNTNRIGIYPNESFAYGQPNCQDQLRGGCASDYPDRGSNTKMY